MTISLARRCLNRRRRIGWRVTASALAASLVLGWPARQAMADDPLKGRTLLFTGVNLAGAEFNPPKPGKSSVYGKDYIYPNLQEVKYFAAKGVNIIRLPFSWERLQPELDHPLDPDELGRLTQFVTQATAANVTVILDPHNYARYHGKVIGGAEVSAASFADFWRRLAGEFRANPQVWFGLMNEPHDLPATQWLGAANAAIAAIRQAEAKNMILVPGVAWTGAHSWISSGNAAVMTGIVDPLDRYFIEVHQYFDKDHSGTAPLAVSATVGSERVAAFTQWCREHHRRALLGEFGTSAQGVGGQAIDDLLRSLEANRDVWVGYTWWAAGPWWGDYMFSVEPKHGVDAPLLQFLTPHM